MTLLLPPFLIFLPGFFIAFHLLHFASCLILGFCLLAHLFCCGPAFFFFFFSLIPSPIFPLYFIRLLC